MMLSAHGKMQPRRHEKYVGFLHVFVLFVVAFNNIKNVTCSQSVKAERVLSLGYVAAPTGESPVTRPSGVNREGTGGGAVR